MLKSERLLKGLTFKKLKKFKINYLKLLFTKIYHLNLDIGYILNLFLILKLVITNKKINRKLNSNFTDEHFSTSLKYDFSNIDDGLRISCLHFIFEQISLQGGQTIDPMCSQPFANLCILIS